ncbi:DUF5677 domain-containing protein [Streptomyces sp. NPDC023838]|uniref:DUF5677 domain-containing protein n=1 Tax=Streptomyces sp. NPDC023838 TaxID=3154325 RepID=UPI0033F81FEE
MDDRTEQCDEEAEVVRQIIAVVGDDLPRLPNLNQPSEDHIPRSFTIPAVALARCRTLLQGIVILTENNRGDVVGVLLRSLYEVWLVGIYGLLGGLDSFEALLDHRDYWQRPLEKEFGWEVKSEGKGKHISVKHLAKEVERLLKEDPEGSLFYDPVGLYRKLYALDSFESVHGGLGSLGKHLKTSYFITAEQAWEIDVPVILEPRDSGLGCTRMTLAGLLVTDFAKLTWTLGGLDPSRLNMLDTALREANRRRF